MERAQAALERAVILAPANVAPRAALAEVHAARGQVRDELATRETVAALDRAGPTALVSLARAYATRGRTDQALAALTRAADQDLGADAVALARARVWVDVASQTTDGAYLARALATLAPLAAAPRTDSEVLTLYGRALLLDGSLAAAERTLHDATRLFPVAPGAFGLLAEAAARRGHHAAAAVARAKHDALTPRR